MFPYNVGILSNGTFPVPVSGQRHTNASSVSSNATANVDHVGFFRVQQACRVDAIRWERASVSVANVYVAIYDQDGNILTDCPVDADTTVGSHSVACTEFALIPSQFYAIQLNGSVPNVASRTSSFHTSESGLILPFSRNGVIAGTVARSNAASPATFDFDSLASGTLAPYFGLEIA